MARLSPKACGVAIVAILALQLTMIVFLPMLSSSQTNMHQQWRGHGSPRDSSQLHRMPERPVQVSQGRHEEMDMDDDGEDEDMAKGYDDDEGDYDPEAGDSMDHVDYDDDDNELEEENNMAPDLAGRPAVDMNQQAAAANDKARAIEGVRRQRLPSEQQQQPNDIENNLARLRRANNPAERQDKTGSHEGVKLDRVSTLAFALPTFSDAQKGGMAWASKQSMDDTSDLQTNWRRLQKLNVSAELSTIEGMDGRINFSDPSRGWHPRDVDVADESFWIQGPPVEVVVVPFSHVDPGWVKTVDRYFEEQVKHILNSVVAFLADEVYGRFIWAETCYLRMWWQQADGHRRTQLQQQIQRGQFEIVAGGEVMPDETLASLPSLVAQLSQGRQWIWQTFGIVPRHGFSVDPFGHSSTISMLNSKAGMWAGVIGRIHWRHRQAMQRDRQLEFLWQTHGSQISSASSIFIRALPYTLYDIHYTCGPDYLTCCRQDYGFYAKHRHARPCQEFGSKETLQFPNTDTLAMNHARQLVQQYRKQAALHRHRVVFRLLGGDFRFASPTEVKQQLFATAKIMHTINSHPEFNMQVRYGTLADVFGKSARQFQHGPGSAMLPRLRGDLLPYSDARRRYWTGFYATRPFLKRASRTLEYMVRAAEMATLRASTSFDQLDRNIQSARQQNGILLHHDAITGTCKENVAVDYMKRGKDGFTHAQEALVGALNQYMSPLSIDKETLGLMDQSGSASKPFAEIRTSPQLVTVFNPIPVDRWALLELLVDCSTVQVQAVEHTGTHLRAQTLPFWDGFKATAPSHTRFRLWFEAPLPALSTSVFRLTCVSDGGDAHHSHGQAPTSPFHCQFRGQADASPPGCQPLSSDDTITIQTRKAEARFNHDGMLDFFSRDGLDAQRLAVRLLQIKERSVGNDIAGAYIFANETEPAPYRSLSTANITVLKGELISQVHVSLTHVRHSVLIADTKAAVGHLPILETIVNLNVTKVEKKVLKPSKKRSSKPRKHGGAAKQEQLQRVIYVAVPSMMDQDIALSIQTDVQQDHVFHSDMNSLGLRERLIWAGKGLAGNIYPVTERAYVGDERQGASVFLDFATGATLLEKGTLMFLLDRQLSRDDSLGMGQGVMDNRPVYFKMVLRPGMLSASTGAQDIALHQHVNMQPWVAILQQQAGSLKSSAAQNPLDQLSSNRADWNWPQELDIVSARTCPAEPQDGLRSTVCTLITVLNRMLEGSVVIRPSQLQGLMIHSEKVNQQQATATSTCEETTLDGRDVLQAACADEMSIVNGDLRTFRMCFEP